MFRWYVCICLLSALLYINTLRAGFVYDDNRAIISNQDIRTTSPITDILKNDFWGTSISSSNSHGSYRPLCVLSFRLNYWAGGLRPFGYHLVNILLHSIATGLVLHTGRLLLPSKCAVSAAAMFAVHPVHTEAVAGVVGRADLLACVFFLLSFIMYVRYVETRRTISIHKVYWKDNTISNKNKSEIMESVTLRYILNNCIYKPFETINKHHYFSSVCILSSCKYLFLSLCFSICSTLCKETGITALGLCTVYEALATRRRRKQMIPSLISLIIVAATGLFAIAFRLLLTGFKPPTFSSADNPVAHDPSVQTRTLTFLYLPIVNFWLLLYPKTLSFDWSMEAIQKVKSIYDYRNILTPIFYVGLFLTIKSSYYKLGKFPSQSHISSKQKLKCLQYCQHSSIRHTSTCRLRNNNNIPNKCFCSVPPSIRLDPNGCLLLCLAFMAIPFLPATNLLFYVGFVVAERVLYLPSIGFCYLCALGLNIIYNKINHSLSVILFIYLVAMHATRTVQRNEDWKDEESLYRSGIHVNPPKAYGNLGSILSSQGRLQEAEQSFRLALSHRPNMADVYYNLGNLQTTLKRYSDAIHSYKMSIKFRPSLAVGYLSLGHLLATLGRYTEAEEVLLKCSKLEATGLKDVKTHRRAQTSALSMLSRLYFERGKPNEAVELYKQAVSIGSQDNNNVVQRSSKNHQSPRSTSVGEKSESLFETTTNILPAFHSKLMSMGKNKTKLQEDSPEWFQLSPLLTLKDPEVYMQLGKYLLDRGRYKEAVNTYLQASQLGVDQYNVVTSAASALREAGKYDDAELFYRKAVSIKPNDSTSLSNLGAILHLQANHKDRKSSYEEAESYYRAALKINPADETAVINLSKLRNWLKRNIT